VDLGGTNLRRVGAQGGAYHDPTWSPDGSSIAFVGEGRIFVIRPDGRELRTLAEGYTRISGIDWAP
jgi:Tol biopolymer transport system component